MSEINPCMTCGACCAYFRVSFYWAEADDAGGLVPAALTEPLTPFLRCMSG
ncbi:YkgJ family cysteine cluster protein, partial [Klebsiella quasipneumoniae]